MAKLNRPEQPVARLGKTGYDMSQITKFTSSVGQLLPVYYDFLSPDEEVEFQCNLFTRTADLQTAAMVNVTEHVDLFFVPLNQLCSYFEDWLNNTKQWNSSLLEKNYSYTMADFPYPRFVGVDMLTIMGNLSQYGKAFESTQETYSGLLSALPGTGFDMFGQPRRYNLYRLLDLFGQGSVLRNYAASPTADWASYKGLDSVYLYFFQAYQKIFFDYYADDDRTQRNVLAFNIDDLFGHDNTVDISDLRSFDDMISMVELRYRPWKKDFFTSVRHSPLMNNGEVNTFGIDLSRVNNWLGQYASHVKLVNSSNVTGPNGPTAVGLDPALTSISYLSQLVDGVNTASIRSMFAVDKLLQRMNRSKRSWDYEELALFGVKPDLGVNGRVMYIGSHSQNLQIGEVVATATTTGSTLGEIGGKGYGFDKSSKLKFKAPCRGILMAIYSAVPEADYTNVGLDRLNTYSYPWDFFNPAFDKLGEQPVFNYQLNNFHNNGLSSTSSSYVRGWHPRYMELKQKYDRVCGDFEYSLNYWTAAKAPMQLGAGSGDLNERNFYIDPTYLDQIFLVSFMPSQSDVLTLGGTFKRDPFRHFLEVNCFKKSTMSPFGIDNL